MTLDGLSLSRATLDRAARRRLEAGLPDALRRDPRTRVLLVAGGLAPVVEAPAGPRMVLPPAVEAAPLLDAPGKPPLLVFLGEEDGGTPHLAAAWPAGRGTEDLADVLPPGTRWAGLREVGALLDDREAGLFTAAVALDAWHAAHGHCARCGARTYVVQAGWVRSCPGCGADHYPRTDPAVIMAVEDPEGRLLLGRQATWPERRFSTLAGFVEPGESLESAVRREVAEETGVQVGAVDYRGSQPWPFPSSLMLGFRATATSTGIAVDGDEIAEARWWEREELAGDVAAGRVLLPPSLSISRRLIEDWFGGPLEGGEAWR